MDIELYNSLRESFWEAYDKRKDYSDLGMLVNGPKESRLIIMPTHSVSHDEWSIAEYAWALSNQCGVLTYIPLPEFDFRRRIPKGKIVVELGGIRRPTIEIDANDLNILRLMSEYFRKSLKSGINLVHFSTHLFQEVGTLDFLSTLCLRIEIPQKYRVSLENSYKFYQILKILVEKLKNLDYGVNDYCQACRATIVLERSPLQRRTEALLLRSFSRCLSHLSQSNLRRIIDYFNRRDLLYNSPENWRKMVGDPERTFKLEISDYCECQKCGAETNITFGFRICGRCAEVRYRGYDRLLKLVVLGKKASAVSSHAFEKVDLYQPESVEVTCLDCKDRFLTKALDKTIVNDYLCPACIKHYDCDRLFDELSQGVITIKDFINMPILRKQYLKSPGGVNE